MNKYGIFILITLLALEVSARFGMMQIHQTPFLNPERVILNFYPELKEARSFERNPDKINLLILGGSVVFEDSVEVVINEEHMKIEFCGLEKLMDDSKYNVLSLSMTGHNTLDSRNKYKYLPKQAHFDAVFVYHGINDTRTNNIHENQFNEDYRHIEFYDDLFIVNRHPEIRFFSLPFMIDWMAHSIQKKKKFYIPKEMFPGLLNGDPEEYVLAGNHSKSVKSFKNNLMAVNKMAQQRNEQLILSSYANHPAEDYSLKKFKAKELDYGQQIFP